jgi:hypothetical protein
LLVGGRSPTGAAIALFRLSASTMPPTLHTLLVQPFVRKPATLSLRAARGNSPRALDRPLRDAQHFFDGDARRAPFSAPSSRSGFIPLAAAT